MQPEPTLRQLRHFLSLSEHCHFGRAAEACLITQSSLSASIREMELVLDAQLFERTKRVVMLTPLGHDLVELARDVIARMDILTEHTKGAGAPLTGDLAMGVIPTIGPFLLTEISRLLRPIQTNWELWFNRIKSQNFPVLHATAIPLNFVRRVSKLEQIFNIIG